jgi:hypothetical protein
LISSGIADERFHGDRFGRQPCRHIFKVLQVVLRRERERVNATSITTARLTQVVQSAASMGKAKSSLQDWLPYEMDRPDGRPRLSADAAATLRSLVHARSLPMPVIAFLMEDLKNADVLA